MRELTVVGVALVLAVTLGAVPATASAGIGAIGDASGSFVATSAGSGGVASASNVGGPSGVTGVQEPCSYPLTVTDATGRDVTVEEEPQEIVTLAPSAAQTLWALNASDKVVGVSVYANYLPGAADKETVQTREGTQIETIVGLEPDLVIAPNVISNDTVAQLESAGVTVYKTESSRNFEDIYAKTERIGALSGECEAADATVTEMRERVTAIRDAVADEESPGAMYVFGNFTTGQGTFIDSVITTAGLTNVPAEAGVSGFSPYDLEIVANNSDSIEWIVVNSNAGGAPSGDVFDRTYAVRNDQVVVLDANYISQPGPYTIRALNNLTRAVHPEAYEEAQAALEPTPTPTETSESGETPTETPTATAESMMTPTATPGEMGGDTPDRTEDPATTANGPGFTAVVGVLAVLAAALFARRRR